MPLQATAQEPIWYADHRDPTMHMPTTLVMHGAGGSHLDWPSEIRRMPELNALAIDLPGHGRSPGKGRTTVGAYAEDMIAFMDALNLKRAILLGHSMGGAIAQTIALYHPERVQGLILAGTGAKLGVHPDLLNGILTELSRSVTTIVNGYYGDMSTDSMRRRTYQQLMEFNPTILYNDYAACNQFDVRDSINRINVPTLIIGGSEDYMTPFKFSEFLHENIAGSKLAKVEGAAHMLILEQPQQVAGIIQSWLLEQKF
ncbi:MAG: alpha/beta hydrolase [Anaerolineae bacterium]